MAPIDRLLNAAAFCRLLERIGDGRSARNPAFPTLAELSQGTRHRKGARGLVPEVGIIGDIDKTPPQSSLAERDEECLLAAKKPILLQAIADRSDDGMASIGFIA